MQSLLIFLLSVVVAFVATRWYLRRLLAEEDARWQPHESPRPPKELAHFDGRQR